MKCPLSAFRGRKEVRIRTFVAQIGIRWTQSFPRTGGVLKTAVRLILPKRGRQEHCVLILVQFGEVARASRPWTTRKMRVPHSNCTSTASYI